MTANHQATKSLDWGREFPANYEMKFVIDEVQIVRALNWARDNLPVDPHADYSSGTYQVLSLYFETLNRAVYHSRKGYRWIKYRVRRYGVAPFVFLELKWRRGNRVAKRRIRIEETELSLLPDPNLKNDWPGFWFCEDLCRYKLVPTLLVKYHRAAFVKNEDQYMRLTIDTPLYCAPAIGCSFACHAQFKFMTGRSILELKYRNSMPGVFKTFIRDLKLKPTPVSKFHLGMSVAGLGGSR
jgi:hypothetical protein